MKRYIETRLVEAKPENAVAEGNDGYCVRYTDGTSVWIPGEDFRRHYLLLDHNRKLKTDKPSVSARMVEDFIRETRTETLGEKTTVVRAMLRNGFEIVESSSCVSPENYDEGLGREICLKKIRDKVWMLLGFLLQTAVSGSEGAEEKRQGLSFGEAIEAMKAGERCRRRGWNGKNQHIELASKISYTAPDGTIVNAEHEAIGNQAVAFCGTSGVQLGWLASQADMLAEDWEIVE